MLVSQILNSKEGQGVVTVPPTTSVSDAIKLLVEKRIGAVVVSGDGKSPDGIFSERDIVRELCRRGPSIMAQPVSDLMTTKIVTCKRTDSADSTLEKMTVGRFRHIPVVEDGKMVGLISIGDVVKARLTELTMEKDALEGMIMGH